MGARNTKFICQHSRIWNPFILGSKFRWLVLIWSPRNMSHGSCSYHPFPCHPSVPHYNCTAFCTECEKPNGDPSILDKEKQNLLNSCNCAGTACSRNKWVTGKCRRGCLPLTEHMKTTTFRELGRITAAPWIVIWDTTTHKEHKSFTTTSNKLSCWKWKNT